MGKFQPYQDHFILFAEAGFIAVNQADEDAALKLFRAAELLKPDNFLPKVGMGYLHLCKLELAQAAKIFTEVLAKEPGNDMAKAFLGISMALSPKDVVKGEKILEESARSKEPAIKKLAADAIDFVEKFIKKAPGPLQGGEPKQPPKGK